MSSGSSPQPEPGLQKALLPSFPLSVSLPCSCSSHLLPFLLTLTGSHNQDQDADFGFNSKYKQSAHTIMGLCLGQDSLELTGDELELRVILPPLPEC